VEKPWEKYRVVCKLDNQYDIVALETQWDYCLEGYFLAHCLGTKDFDEFNENHVAYSLRDSLQIPHATILCLRDGKWSDYGHSSDLGSTAYFYPESGLRARVLQVRGREDCVAALPYHRLVREWYKDHGGELVITDDRLDFWCNSRMTGDHDEFYHYKYLLNTAVNFFHWASHNDKLRKAYTPR
jgi:hypothetical protein